MGSSSLAVRATTALALIWAFVATVNAQGFFFQQEETSCSADQSFQYLGCYAVTAQPFSFAPVNPGAGGLHPSNSWIEYDTGDRVNITINSNLCARACRAHGFRYPALYNGGCVCGSSLANSPQSLTTTVDEDNCASRCPGDQRDSCGTPSHARIFVDTSFKKEADISLDPAPVQAAFTPLGCFYSPNGWGDGGDITDQPTADACFARCTSMNLPMMFMYKNSGQIKCNCGANFPERARTFVDPVGDRCSVSCANGGTTCTGNDCCGNSGAQVYPVYANPALMGCLLPVIPGIADPAVETPADNAYTCIETPAAITGRPTFQEDYGSATISLWATIVATAAPAADVKYIPYGCFPGSSTNANNPLVGAVTVPKTSLTGGKVTVDTCIEYCNSQSLDWAALQAQEVGSTADSVCVCGSAPGANLGTIDPMGSCNRPCSGNDAAGVVDGVQQLCGHNNGYIVYVNQANVAATNPASNTWFATWTASYSMTPTYSCLPTAATTTSAATTSSATEAPTTTSEEPGTTTEEPGTTSATDAPTTTEEPGTTSATDAPTTTGGSDTISPTDAPTTTGGSDTISPTDAPTTTGGSDTISATDAPTLTDIVSETTAAPISTDVVSETTTAPMSTSTSPDTTGVEIMTTTGTTTVATTEVIISSGTTTVITTDIVITTTATATFSASGTTSPSGSLSLPDTSILPGTTAATTSESNGSQTTEIGGTTTAVVDTSSPAGSPSGMSVSSSIVIGVTTDATTAVVATSSPLGSSSGISLPSSVGVSTRSTTAVIGTSSPAGSSPGVSPPSSVGVSTRSTAVTASSSPLGSSSGVSSPASSVGVSTRTTAVTGPSSPLGSSSGVSSPASSVGVSTRTTAVTASSSPLGSSSGVPPPPSSVGVSTRTTAVTGPSSPLGSSSGVSPASSVGVSTRSTTAVIGTSSPEGSSPGVSPPSSSGTSSRTTTIILDTSSPVGSPSPSGSSVSSTTGVPPAQFTTQEGTVVSSDTNSPVGPPRPTTTSAGGPAPSQSQEASMTPSPVASSSASSSSSSSTTTTSFDSTPTVEVVSTNPVPFADIFNTSAVPEGKGAVVSLTVYDPVTGEASAATFVVQYFGCFSIPENTSPFVGNDTRNFTGNAQAGESSAACAGFCAGVDLTLSADNSGTCFCGSALADLSASEDDSRSGCSGSPGQKTKRRWLMRRDSFISIIFAKNAAEAVLITGNNDTSTSTTMTASATSTATIANTASTASTANTVNTVNSASTLPPSATSSLPFSAPFGNSSMPTGSATGSAETNSATGGPAPTGPASESASGSMGPSATGSSGGPSNPSVTGSASGSGSGFPSATGSVSGSGVATMATSSSTGAPAGITNIPMIPVLLGVIPSVPAVNNTKRDYPIARRQAAGTTTPGGFVGGAGPVNPASCNDATPFNLTDGMLLSGGEAVATDPGVAFMEIHVVPGGTISTTFSIVNGFLVWANETFLPDGRAGFCQAPSGQVYATFVPPPVGPPNCAPVNIIVYEATRCVDGAIVSASTTSVALASAVLPTATNLVPQQPGKFPLNASPMDEVCATTTLSWVPGMPTFIALEEREL